MSGSESAGLRGKILSGALWSTGARVGQQGTQFLTSVILARLLMPRDFGIIGMALVFTGFARAFSEFGVGAAIVQRPELRDEHLDTAFWLNAAISAVLTAVLVLCAPLVAVLYHAPEAVPVMRAIAFVFVVTAPSIAPLSVLQRRMEYRRFSLITTAGTIGSSVLGVGLALSGAGVWSLVVQYLSSGAISTVLGLTFCGWTPRFRVSRSAVRDLWGFSANLAAFNTVNYWARNGDNLLVGKFFGAVSLGLYTRVYGLMLIPINQVVYSIYSVLFSALSSVQHDKARVREIYLRAVGIVALVSFPLMAGLVVAAQPFVLALYGPKWAAIVPLLRVMAITGIVQAMTTPTGPIYMSQGRTDWMFRFGLLSSGVFVGSFVLGVVLGSVQALAVCYTAANVILLYPWLAIPGRLIDLSMLSVARTVSGPTLASVLMGGAVLALEAVIPTAWAAWQQLMSEVAAGGIIYALCVTGLRVQAWLDLVEIVRDRLPGRARLSQAKV